MDRTRIRSKSHVLLVIALLATVLLLIGGVMSVEAGPSPKRLRLKVEMSTLKESDQTKIVVEFLDREYLPVVNDREREVRFELVPVSSGAVGAGEILPARVNLPSGRQSSPGITFAAQKPGRVIIRATSEGLESAQTLLTIAPSTPPLPSMRYRAHPDAPPQVKLKIYPEDVQRVVANGRSAATMWVTTDRPLSAGERLFIRVVTDPDANILAKAQEPGSMGFMDIRIGEGSAQSDDIQIRSSRPGTVKVSAQIVPDGPSDRVAVQFEPPQPAEIVLRDVPPALPTSRRKVLFTVRLADESHVPLEALQQEWRIQLGTDGDPDEVTFDPDTVILSPHQLSGQAVLHLKRFPPDGQVRLLALDAARRLPHTEKAITLTSPIQKVLVTGRSEVPRGQNSSDLTLHLLDTNKRHVTADLIRKVMVRAERGVVNPSEVWITQGQEHGHVVYVSPSEVGEDTVTAESPGLELGDWKITVVTATAIMTLFAGLGGMVGGVIRQVFKGQVRYPLPNWTGGHLKPGLVGNALGSIVFGLILFQSVKLGLFPMADWLGHGSNPSLDSRMFAFFCGVLGGFGGVMVLEHLLDRVFPGRSRGKTPSATPPAPSPHPISASKRPISA